VQLTAVRDDAAVGEWVGRRNVAWRERTVYTGVWKHPVDGRRRARRGNLDGDGQGDLAGHGGEQRAVLAYQLDSYRHWRAELRRPPRPPAPHECTPTTTYGCINATVWVDE
jgi:MOSC domain-containing protein YiiM